MDNKISAMPKAERNVTDTRTVPFGKVPTDHMYIAEYRDGTWHNGHVTPFHKLEMSPLSLCLHYGQTVFEGMKAFLTNDGKVNIFRIDKHHERFNRSLNRMCMPAVPKELFEDAVKQVVAADRAWVPADEDGSLYIRPFMIATEDRIGVKISDEYLFMVVCSPAYQYYSSPLRVKVETQFSRAADGGTGAAKCGGNYGGAFYPTQKAKEEGFDQVLWTDSKTHSFIEESGTMNAMFYIDDVLITPALSGSILDGVTRDSMLAIAADMGIKTEARPVSLDELKKALTSGQRVEAFGAGTAAVVAPIESISIDGESFSCYTGEDALMYRLKNALNDIRKGTATDKHHWNYLV